MLRQVAEGVLIHQSELLENNAVVVQGRAGVLLIDPGVTDAEMVCLADDLRALGDPVVAGFSTHPDWDHVLWHAELSTGLPAETAKIPWDGPHVRIIEHQAHAPGHAALLIEERRVLVAGDMLSDVFIPLLDVSAADPIGDYLAALRLLEGVADEVDVFVPGHGSVGGAEQLRARIDQDRTYVQALRDHQVVSDPRIGPSAKKGWEWVSDVHAGQLQQLAKKREHDGTPG